LVFVGVFVGVILGDKLIVGVILGDKLIVGVFVGVIDGVGVWLLAGTETSSTQQGWSVVVPVTGTYPSNEKLSCIVK
jgi:hypothetical protein